MNVFQRQQVSQPMFFCAIQQWYSLEITMTDICL